MSYETTPLRHEGIAALLQAALGERYVLTGVVGRGGMGEVYRAHDCRHDRDVAIKLLPPELATALAAERFVLETRIAAKLVHPNIIGLIDSGEADGLLYYIMPLVEGETLRQRLQRERRLRPADAAHIAAQVASALAFAHANGVVHRDIKPENVLLVDGVDAMVADFGLALAILRSADRRITVSRHIVGTVSYMSPEVASGTEDVDGRADVYGLGCMLYEMLTGRPPFTGPSEYAIMAQHISSPPPRLPIRRLGIPAALEPVVCRAIAKAREDRYSTAAELARDLEGAVRSSTTWISVLRLLWGRITRPGVRRWTIGVLLLLAATAALFASPGSGGMRERIGALWRPSLRDSRYAVFPLRGMTSVVGGDDVAQRLREELARYDGLDPVDHFQLREAVTRAGPAAGAEELQRIARRAGARHAVIGDANIAGDSVRLAIGVFDSQTGLRTSFVRTTVPRSALRSAATLEPIVDDLLFPLTAAVRGPQRPRGTTSLEAGLGFEAGHRALRQWEMAAAESAFTAAIARDREYGAAHYWLAQVKSWATDRADDWSVPAGRAVSLAAELTAREGELALALDEMSRREFPEACRRYRRLMADTPTDVVATFGLAECLRRDDVVVPDASSPSTWRFRSSRHSALEHYRLALAQEPGMYRALGDDAFGRLRRWFFTATNERLTGVSSSGGGRAFTGAAHWAGDSLLLVPHADDDGAQVARAVSATATIAAQRQRERFRQLASMVRAAFPDDDRPREAMTLALELLGDRDAVESLTVARRTARDSGVLARLSIQETWLRVKFGLPADTGQLAAARRLADSLLAAAPTSHDEQYAGLALLTGRVHRAAAIAHRSSPASTVSGLRPSAEGDAAALLAYATIGAPRESIIVIERRLERDLHRLPQPRAESHIALLDQALPLAFPVHRFASLGHLSDGSNGLADAQLALVRGDTAKALRVMSERRAMGNLRLPADRSLDVTVASALTLQAAGRPAEAIAWLDPVLEASEMYAPHAVSRFYTAGSLMRAMILRADLAWALGDPAGAARWAQPLIVLWSNADPVLRPIVARMRAYVNAARNPSPGR